MVRSNFWFVGTRTNSQKLKDAKNNTIEVQPEKEKTAIITTISLTEEEWIISFATGNFVLRRVEE